VSGAKTIKIEEPRLWLIRHGATEWSLRGKHTGLTDLPLLPEGRNEAEKLGKRLRGYAFAAVFTSPLQRARETCALSGLGAKAEVLPDLVEWNYGAYEGLTSVEIRKTNPSWQLFRDGCPQGESVAAAAARLDRAIGTILGHFTGESGDVAIFSHGHALRVLALRYLGWPLEAGAQLLLDTTAVCRVKDDRGRRSLEIWNDRSHLRTP
jgi:probable phosphoglycerate mutase